MSGSTSQPVRSIRQPGPPAAERRLVVEAGSISVDAVVPAGVRLLDALHALLTDGVESASLSLAGGSLAPFAYVIPALSPDADHAAFYSQTFRPAGETRIDAGSVTVGFRDGAPFFHCHAIWTEADGHRGCGHVLPDETIVATPIRVRGAGLVGARFETRPDAETGFNLFIPIATGTKPPAVARPALAVRFAPNQDLSQTLEQVGTAAGYGRAVVAGGVGSTLGARFVDGSVLEGFATELLVRSGRVRCGTEGPDTQLEIAIVDLDGTIREGELTRGDNPVLMTFEGVLEAA